MQLDPFSWPVWWRRYSFTIVTAVLFLAAGFGQFYFQAQAFAEDGGEHGGSPGWGDFWNVFLASTFENWQSEFLQLCWQAAGLALFYHWRSSQSREQQDRIEQQLAEAKVSLNRLNVAVVKLHAAIDQDEQP